MGDAERPEATDVVPKSGKKIGGANPDDVREVHGEKPPATSPPPSAGDDDSELEGISTKGGAENIRRTLKHAHDGEKHPGFAGAAKSISAKSGYGMDRARAILASKTREASPEAKKANPRLNKVKG
jgi:hypothetical protein